MRGRPERPHTALARAAGPALPALLLALACNGAGASQVGASAGGSGEDGRAGAAGAVSAGGSGGASSGGSSGFGGGTAAGNAGAAGAAPSEGAAGVAGTTPDDGSAGAMGGVPGAGGGGASGSVRTLVDVSLLDGGATTNLVLNPTLDMGAFMTWLAFANEGASPTVLFKRVLSSAPSGQSVFEMAGTDGAAGGSILLGLLEVTKAPFTCSVWLGRRGTVAPLNPVVSLVFVAEGQGSSQQAVDLGGDVTSDQTRGGITWRRFRATSGSDGLGVGFLYVATNAADTLLLNGPDLRAAVGEETSHLAALRAPGRTERRAIERARRRQPPLVPARGHPAGASLRGRHTAF